MDFLAVLSDLVGGHKQLWIDFESVAFGDGPARSEAEVLKEYFSLSWLDEALGLG